MPALSSGKASVKKTTRKPWGWRPVRPLAHRVPLAANRTNDYAPVAAGGRLLLTRSMPARTLACCLALLLAGCTGSRWAKQDPDYAAKYPRHTDDVGRTIKQAVDARHLRQKNGAYGSLSARDEPVAMGAEFGLLRYPNPWLEGRVGVAGLIYENDDIPMSGGGVAAVRLQTPTRLAPFIGLGGYAGMTPEVGATNDNIDNDGDLYIDEFDETDQGFVFAMIPETGIHFWLTPGWRLTASASYTMPSSGRDDDFWMYGISLSCLTDLASPRIRKHSESTPPIAAGKLAMDIHRDIGPLRITRRPNRSIRHNDRNISPKKPPSYYRETTISGKPCTTICRRPSPCRESKPPASRWLTLLLADARISLALRSCRSLPHARPVRSILGANSSQPNSTADRPRPAPLP